MSGTGPDGPGYGVCSADGECITCGDVAVPLTVVEAAAGGADARCRDGEGREETVAVELVGPVAAGDLLLVHAGVAIEIVARPQSQTGGRDAVRG